MLTLIGIWAVFIIFSFWYFQARNIKIFDEFSLLHTYQNVSEHAALKEKIIQQLGIKISLTNKTLIHFHWPECDCNNISASHIKEINQKYSAQGFDIYLVTVSGANQQKIIDELSIGNIIEIESFFELGWLPALPAVAIFDQSRLAYLGPYSSGTFCGPSNSYVELTLKLLRQGNNPQLVNGLEKGCYCQLVN